MIEIVGTTVFMIPSLGFSLLSLRVSRPVLGLPWVCWYSVWARLGQELLNSKPFPAGLQRPEDKAVAPTVPGVDITPGAHSDQSEP